MYGTLHVRSTAFLNGTLICSFDTKGIPYFQLQYKWT